MCPFRVRVSRCAAAPSQRVRWRLSERRFVTAGKPSQFVKPVVGRDSGNRGCVCGRVVERLPHALESLREDASLGARATDAVERIAEAALTESHDPAQSGEGHRTFAMCARVRFHSLHDLPLRRILRRPGRAAAAGTFHDAYGTSCTRRRELSGLPERTVRTDRKYGPRDRVWAWVDRSVKRLRSACRRAAAGAQVARASACAHQYGDGTIPARSRVARDS